ncbi:MAG TPA: VOC family protein [Kofleriaceae bacterium]
MRQIFVNLAVRDLAQAKRFFTELGFELNPQFTDDKAACMIVNDQAFVMLLAAPFFQTFTKRELCDTSRATEGMFALSCASRAEVDDLVHKAIAAGGRHAMEPQDHGFMYGWSFYDLDGHHWEVVWMDPKAAPPH